MEQDEIREMKWSTVAITGNGAGEAVSLRLAGETWQSDGRAIWQQMDALVETLDGLTSETPLQLGDVSVSTLILDERESGF